MMRLSVSLAALITLAPLALSACATSKAPLDPVRANAFLPAAEFGALQSWQALRDGSILIQGQDKKYHRATFTAPCAGLAGAPSVTLKVSKMGEISQVQGVTPMQAGGAETCYFNTLEPVDDPKSLAIASPSAPVEGRQLPAPTR